MRSKMIIFSVAAGLTLIVSLAALCEARVPSSEELSGVVGGGWRYYKKCTANRRCTITDSPCDNDMCDGGAPNDDCGDWHDYTAREGCTCDVDHKCRTDTGSQLLCKKYGSCKCTGVVGSLTCDKSSTTTENVYPCTQQEY
jgi:hypothetical protein